MEKTSVPLWLEIKPEYIDENIDKVLEYLYKGGCILIARTVSIRTLCLFSRKD
jgi:hypothetical protein